MIAEILNNDLHVQLYEDWLEHKESLSKARRILENAEDSYEYTFREIRKQKAESAELGQSVNEEENEKIEQQALQKLEKARTEYAIFEKKWQEDEKFYEPGIEFWEEGEKYAQQAKEHGAAVGRYLKQATSRYICLNSNDDLYKQIEAGDYDYTQQATICYEQVEKEYNKRVECLQKKYEYYKKAYDAVKANEASMTPNHPESTGSNLDNLKKADGPT